MSLMVKNKIMANKIPNTLPKITFTNDDHTKIKKAMLLYDPMKKMLINLHDNYFRGILLTDEQNKIFIELEKLVNHLKK